MNRRSFFAALVAFAASLLFGRERGQRLRAVILPNHSGKSLLAKRGVCVWSSMPRSAQVGEVTRAYNYRDCLIDQWRIIQLRRRVV
jgi:hypothetical protein